MSGWSKANKITAVLGGIVGLIIVLGGAGLWAADHRYVTRNSQDAIYRALACALFEEDLPGCRQEIRREWFDQRHRR